MNLALLIENLEVGGSESVVQRLALGLARRGHGVFLYCLRAADIPTGHLEAGGVVVREARAVGRDWGLPRQLVRWFRQDRIHLAHAHCVGAVIAAFPAARILGIPLVHVWHGWDPGRPTRARRLAVELSRYLAGVGVNSESLRERLPQRGPLRCASSLPNGIDLPPVGPREARRRLAELCGDDLSGPVVLSIGNIRPEKDQITLLEAAALLRRRRPDLRVVGIGLWQDCEYWAEVCRRRRELGLEHTVLFPGPCPEAWRLLAGADVFCLSSSRESMPNVVLEAMTQRVPIVATAVGDVGRLDSVPEAHWLLRHQDTALLVSPGQPRALAAALARTWRNPDAAQRRADRAYEDYRRRFTSEHMVQRYEAFYARGRRRRQRPSPERRTTALMVGPSAESLGGMATSITRLMSSALRDSYTLHRFSTPQRAAEADCGACTRGGGGRAKLVATSEAVWRHLSALGRLVGVLVRRRVDLVHIHTCSRFTFQRNVADAMLARLLGRRVILHIRGGHFERFCAAAGRMARAWIRMGFALADAVIVLSPDWRRRLAPYVGRTPVFVVPNGVEVVDRPSATERGPHAPCRFLYLAALTEAKGLADLIDAARQLKADGVPFELIVAGPVTDAPLSVWEDRLRAAGLADVVRLVGSVAGAAKDHLLATADCFVHPSHCEALPNAVLEAAAVGLPVVATAVGSVPEVVGAGHAEGPFALLVPPRDAAALARALRRMAADPARRRLGERLRDHVAANYSLAETVRQVAAVYEFVRRRRPARAVVEAPLVHHVTYRLHEWLRGRPTVREYRWLATLPALSPAELERDVQRRLRELLRFAGGAPRSPETNTTMDATFPQPLPGREGGRNGTSRVHSQAGGTKTLPAPAGGTPTLPYYAQAFRRCGVNPDGDDPFAELRKLPPLTKRDVRDHGDAMTWRDVRGGLRPASSGGTTGDTIYFHTDAVRQAQDLAARLFMQGLFGIRPGERRLHLWGSPIESRGGRLRRYRDRLLNEMLLDAFDLSPARLDAHLRRLCRFRPAVVYGYTTAVTLLARHSTARFRPGDFDWLRLAVLTGEEILPEHVAMVQSAWGCAVAAEYGNREVGLIAHECPRGRLHVLSPHVLVEIVQDGRPVPAGQCGEIVCTPLNTRAQPFLRYRVGDVGRLVPEPCPCGLALPVLRVEGGKIAGFLTMPDGRLCHGAVSSHALKGLPGIVAFRTHQRRVDWIEVLLVVNAAFEPQAIETIRRRYRVLFGPHVRVDCRIVDEIPPDPSGKRRHVISDVSPHATHIELAELPH
ncbi:MAG: glycosyltransferase [Planctomycetota bacterium]